MKRFTAEDFNRMPVEGQGRSSLADSGAGSSGDRSVDVMIMRLIEENYKLRDQLKCQEEKETRERDSRDPPKERSRSPKRGRSPRRRSSANPLTRRRSASSARTSVATGARVDVASGAQAPLRAGRNSSSLRTRPQSLSRRRRGEHVPRSRNGVRQKGVLASSSRRRPRGARRLRPLRKEVLRSQTSAALVSRPILPG